MSKFKIGDKVIVTEKIGLDDTQLYEVGSIGIVVKSMDGYKWGNVDFNGNIEDVYRKEVKHYEETEMALTSTMTAEQIRNEILRIGVRIEEAKKDIENAEKERDSLVEKLREKGFEIACQRKVLPLLDNPFLEINAEYVINEKNSSTWMEQGTKVICTDIDPSSRKLDARVEDSEGNEDWVNSECLTKI